MKEYIQVLKSKLDYKWHLKQYRTIDNFSSNYYQCLLLLEQPPDLMTSILYDDDDDYMVGVVQCIQSTDD